MSGHGGSGAAIVLVLFILLVIILVAASGGSRYGSCCGDSRSGLGAAYLDERFPFPVL
ncbi:hypothetical protein VQL36_05000 [Chengkuizengella sp. SCS-71B]|uniref:sporulation protein YjcZ n=1 Tax=Chengkuizengella sp. SCS-71B TaxID=3115290 RepID=UPI0032C23DC4